MKLLILFFVVLSSTLLASGGSLLGSGGGGGAVWGGITGTLSDQTDLQTALNAKLSLSGGTTTGAITDLSFTGQSEKALTGTATFTASSATVTGSGTAFLTEVHVGDRIYPNALSTAPYYVKKVTSNTSLSLSFAFQTSTVSGATVHDLPGGFSSADSSTGLPHFFVDGFGGIALGDISGFHLPFFKDTTNIVVGNGNGFALVTSDMSYYMKMGAAAGGLSITANGLTYTLGTTGFAGNRAVYSFQTAESVSANAVTIDWITSNTHSVPLTGATGTVAISFSNANDGNSIQVQIVNAATPQSVTFPGTVKWAGGVAYAATLTNGAVDKLYFTKIGGVITGDYKLDYK